MDEPITSERPKFYSRFAVQRVYGGINFFHVGSRLSDTNLHTTIRKSVNIDESEK